PLLETAALRERFVETVIVYNSVAYPFGVGLWIWKVLSLRPVFNQRRSNLPIAEKTLAGARRRLIHLPWWAAGISAAAWLFGVPVFLGSLAQVQDSPDTRL